MNRFCFILIGLFLSLGTFAQETKEVLRGIQDPDAIHTTGYGRNTDLFEKFFVLKSDKKTLHGPYIKYRERFTGVRLIESGVYKNGLKEGLWTKFYESPLSISANEIKEEGSYVNGKKEGVWKYYFKYSPVVKLIGTYLNDERTGEWSSFAYSGELFHKYDFSKQKLIFDTSLRDSLSYNTNRRALFIGGEVCLVDFLMNEFKATPQLFSKMSRDSSSVLISFFIGEKGELSEPKIEQSFGYANFLEKESKRAATSTSGNWLPALSNSKKVNSIYKILFFMTRKGTTEEKQFKVGARSVFD